MANSGSAYGDGWGTHDLMVKLRNIEMAFSIVRRRMKFGVPNFIHLPTILTTISILGNLTLSIRAVFWWNAIDRTFHLYQLHVLLIRIPHSGEHFFVNLRYSNTSLQRTPAGPKKFARYSKLSTIKSIFLCSKKCFCPLYRVSAIERYSVLTTKLREIE